MDTPFHHRIVDCLWMSTFSRSVVMSSLDDLKLSEAYRSYLKKQPVIQDLNLHSLKVAASNLKQTDPFRWKLFGLVKQLNAASEENTDLAYDPDTQQLIIEELPHVECPDDFLYLVRNYDCVDLTEPIVQCGELAVNKEDAVRLLLQKLFSQKE